MARISSDMFYSAGLCVPAPPPPGAHQFFPCRTPAPRPAASRRARAGRAALIHGSATLASVSAHSATRRQAAPLRQSLALHFQTRRTSSTSSSKKGGKGKQRRLGFHGVLLALSRPAGLLHPWAEQRQRRAEGDCSATPATPAGGFPSPASARPRRAAWLHAVGLAAARLLLC